MSDIRCADCWAFRRLGYFEACWKHATAEQRADAERFILGLAERPNPMLAFLERKR